MLRQALTTLQVDTSGAGLRDITEETQRWVSVQGIATGLLTVFIRHTSASLLIQENADPTVRADLDAFFRRIAPEQCGLYAHDDEGLDDMPSHIRAALTASSLGVPIADGRPRLGMWQAIYIYEHRARPHRREVVLHLLGA